MQTQTRDIASITASAGEQIASIEMEPAPTVHLQVDVFDSMAPLEAEWRALEQDDLNSLHQSYDWCAAWAENLKRPLAIVGAPSELTSPSSCRSRSSAVTG